ncbi:MAG: MarR family transcriptional regulator [Herbiconiux sp.]|uniref:MarR family winged helix-turn-helix transcriptional regulator n=1 Tax=Herbiconiux sp. TaxID=1871186 RepID=UPI00121FC447|nr:MarR family transcriptional regulator [Herbiconiux sp.]TAJ47306.1 MAG: MarR family transcriptional regulator [Herbiconiux sp.]
MDTVAQDRAMELLGRFNDQLTSIVDDAFGSEWAEIEEILALIALVADHVVTTRRLAELSGLNRRAISRLVARLRSEGLVSTRHSDADGRVIEVVLTDHGERQAAQFRTAIADFFRRSRDLALELSSGTGPVDTRMTQTLLDPIDLLRRVCEAGASLVAFMPDAATQGQLAARQRAALVQITTQHGVRPADLSPSLGVSRAGAAYIVDQLCAKGFISRRHGAVDEDRRAVVLEATAEGIQAVRAVMDGIEHQQELLGHLFAEVAAWHQPPVKTGRSRPAVDQVG